MPHPKDVYTSPKGHWSFLTAKTDEDFEGQHFDRKEACRTDPSGNLQGGHLAKVKVQIQEVISAFSQANREGGLLVLGIASNGDVKGIDHLTEEQLNSLTKLDDLLIHHCATVRLIDCSEECGETKTICLVYAGFVERYICETPGRSPKAWIRQGRQNIPLTDALREQIKRDKKILDFENTLCCPYDAADLDEDVVAQFKQSYLRDAAYQYSVEEMLRAAGAIEKVDGGYVFNNAGLLFFGSNPKRILPWAYTRLTRFSPTIEHDPKGLPTFERDFDGPLTKQIRNLRTFFKESGFFKVLQKRGETGGFVEEPELPFLAVDEAVVNAVAHRDYGIRRPIEVESYKDGLLVRNPGPIQQRDHDLPDQFTLSDVRLDSAPRNSKLIEWLRSIRDEQGIPFVRALSEGTETMRKEMEALALPAPIYKVSSTQTQVTLYSNIDRREDQFLSGLTDEPTQFANLFPVKIDKGLMLESETDTKSIRRELMISLREALSRKKWFVDHFRFSRLVAHRKGITLRVPKGIERIVKLYPAYSFQFRQYKQRYYLCIDYELEVKNVQRLQDLQHTLSTRDLVGRAATVFWQGWRLGKILSFDSEMARVKIFDYETEEVIPSEKVIPNLSKQVIDAQIRESGISFDLNRAIKQHSLSLDPNASRARFDKTIAIAQNLSTTIFPLQLNNGSARLTTDPIALSSAKSTNFAVRILREPNVVFAQGHSESDIREGITRFGAYTDSPKTVELVPICSLPLRNGMASLIERLKAGQYKYRGSERTFHTRFIYNTIITTESDRGTIKECERLLREHPEWIGNEDLSRIFLVHSPESGYASDDENSPYYQTKRFLLERGLPCQMVDTPTIANPDWKDLNLALNITAKCGVTPWVLPDAIPDADFFVGISYTQSLKQDTRRFFGYANVFNSFGKWMFYSGNAQTFSELEKTNQFHNLVKSTLERLTLSDTPSIHFHYSSKFSKLDMAGILAAARSVRPNGNYSFVWINTHHTIRLYDIRPETDGSLSRGSYVVTSPNQFLISTTGHNPYRRAIGTPQMLEANVWIERPDWMPQSPPDLRSTAVQLLSLTKLNWASTDSLCAEPITTKYAGDIAYLRSAFARQGYESEFKLHQVLEKTPWFI